MQTRKDAEPQMMLSSFSITHSDQTNYLNVQKYSAFNKLPEHFLGENCCHFPNLIFLLQPPNPKVPSALKEAVNDDLGF